MARNQVLLIGNGINNIAGQYTWADLVNDLIRFVGAARRQIDPSNKPFPLLYEEIVAFGARNKGLKESDIKKQVARLTATFQPSEIHSELMRLGLKNILTTNYDTTLEMVNGNDALPNEGVIKEGLYSLFRVAKTGKTRIWHIHGVRHSPQTIALGYEHYGGYFQRMRNYILGGTERAYKRQFVSLETRLRKHDVVFDSWVDFFFTQNVSIVGLSLDFVEMHLWWLFTYRAKRKYTKLTPIRNQISYFYPKCFESNIRSRLQLLQANDVVLRQVVLKSDDWKSYYRRVLDRVNEGVS